jgi:alkylhydroperoxidase/carboxymuconolactone decarboxylase family protein YurZ
MFGGFAPGLVHFTDDVLFGEVWKRPQLSPKERSLITVAALTAGGNAEQLTFHLQFAKDNGATEEELIEAITHLAFYAGWPKAMSAMSVAKQESMLQAIRSTRPGGHVGYVGVSHDVELPGQELFFSAVHLHGGPAPVRRFLPELIELICDRAIDPGRVFDLTLPLEAAAEGYRAMDERRAIKTLLRP